ncbi:MAG: hypothetical protein K8L99_27855 [Anaerolineae bacterium]|nr:hypothetical protein [Anaerolineae bacterium]
MNRRFSETLLGLFLLIIGISALVGDSANVFMLFLIIGGIYMLVRQREGGTLPWQNVEREPRYRPVEPDENASGSRARIFAHAMNAMEEAGVDPETASVLVTDIGLMSFKDEAEPTIHRMQPVPDDVDYIQPFVQVRVPTRAVGLIRFEIIDSDGQVLFIHEDRHQLERGRNLISPGSRLPIHDAHALYNDWELRVNADGILLASHHFNWEENASRVIRRHLSEDGEISSELRAAMAENRLQRMSLDDLLSTQEDETENQQRS